MSYDICMTRSLRRDYEYKLASNRSVNVKQFWKYVNSRLKTHPSISALKRPDNSVTNSDQEKSELFNDFFASVFTKETPLSSCPFQLDSDVLPLSNIAITPYVVYVIVVTWAREICLICMPEARGPQARGLRAYISGKSREHMLQVICITSDCGFC